ncbi:hypothetical protein Drorol1_Dr00027539 [Drosera rotundifolia]
MMSPMFGENQQVMEIALSKAHDDPDVFERIENGGTDVLAKDLELSPEVVENQQVMKARHSGAPELLKKPANEEAELAAEHPRIDYEEEESAHEGTVGDLQEELGCNKPHVIKDVPMEVNADVAKSVNDEHVDGEGFKYIQPSIEDGTLHLIGLLSDGGVHSGLDQLHVLLKEAAERGNKRKRMHILTDGRYVLDGSNMSFVETLEGDLSKLREAGIDAWIASVGGRQERGGISRRSEYRVIVTGLPKSVSWQDLKDHMCRAGDVCFSQIFNDDAGTNGIVDYISYDDMKNAIRKLDDSEFRNAFGRAYVRVKEYKGSTSKSCSRSPARSRSYSRSCSKSPSRRHSRGSETVKFIDMAADEAVKIMIDAIEQVGGMYIITADHGNDEDKVNVNLVIEFCAGGEFFDRIIAKGHYSEKVAASILRQIVNVVHVCRFMGVLHRNVKTPDVHMFLQHLITFGIVRKDDVILYRKLVLVLLEGSRCLSSMYPLVWAMNCLI